MKTFPYSLAIGSVTTLFASALLSSAPVSAAQIIDFRSNGDTGRVDSATFTGGTFQLTAVRVNSPQNYVTASEKTGLCLFANSSNDVNRCGMLSEEVRPLNYNKVGLSSNKDLVYTGFNISQILIEGFINPNPPGTGELKVWRNQANVGTLLETINLATISVGSTVNFLAPFRFGAGERIVFQASGVNSSIRLGSVTVEDVPGPLPVLGVGAAFAFSRKLRRRCNNIT